MSILISRQQIEFDAAVGGKSNVTVTYVQPPGGCGADK
jgi:hypothetical protein